MELERDFCIVFPQPIVIQPIAEFKGEHGEADTCGDLQADDSSVQHDHPYALMPTSELTISRGNLFEQC